MFINTPMLFIIQKYAAICRQLRITFIICADDQYYYNTEVIPPSSRLVVCQAQITRGDIPAVLGYGFGLTEEWKGERRASKLHRSSHIPAYYRTRFSQQYTLSTLTIDAGFICDALYGGAEIVAQPSTFMLDYKRWLIREVRRVVEGNVLLEVEPINETAPKSYLIVREQIENELRALGFREINNTVRMFDYVLTWNTAAENECYEIQLQLVKLSP